MGCYKSWGVTKTCKDGYSRYMIKGFGIWSCCQSHFFTVELSISDAQCVGDYNIVDGNKLHLVVRKDDVEEQSALYSELDKFLVRHFSKKDAAKIVDYYKKVRL